MIKFSATNVLVHMVTPVMQVTDNFQKRELIIDDSWDKDGKHYSSFVLVEFTGDKMSQLDGIYPGQRINIEGMITGREYNERIYNSVRGLSVTPYQAQQQYQPAPSPVPNGYPQQPPYPQQQYPPQTQYPQQPQAQYPQQPQAQYPQQGTFQSAPQPGGYPPPQAQAYPQQQHAMANAPVPNPATAPASYGHATPPGANDLPFDH